MKNNFSVLLDNIRSALNVGAIFRTCECAGVEKLYLTGITPYPPHNRIPKTALGAIEMVEWEHSKNTIEVIKRLKSKGQKIVSVEINDKAKNIYEYEFEFPTTIVLGNEISGVSEEIQALSDETVYLPMFGQKESLNVATTTGIVVYEMVRQQLYNKVPS